jgi:hypothetical protein
MDQQASGIHCERQIDDLSGQRGGALARFLKKYLFDGSCML